jgi:hypothetical protein
MSITRRGFLASLAATVPLALLARRAHAAAVEHVQSDPATLDALALTVLPSKLGRAAIMREAAAFRDWATKYKEMRSWCTATARHASARRDRRRSLDGRRSSISSTPTRSGCASDASVI